jgi:hypothetical protein
LGFVRFTDVGTKGHRPRVSIRTNGQLGFNRGAVKRFELSKFLYAVLFYDPVEMRIGIKLTDNADEPGASKLRVKAHNAYMAARSFLDSNKIEYLDKTKSYEAKLEIDFDIGEELIIVSLR